MCHFPRLYNQVLYIMQTPYIARVDFYFFPRLKTSNYKQKFIYLWLIEFYKWVPNNNL